MKKLLSMFVLTLVLLLGACDTSEDVKTINLEGSLEQIMSDIYANADYDNSNMVTKEVAEDRRSFYFGEAEVEYEESLASDPQFGFGHSIVLLRLDDTSKVDDYKASLKENVDRCKWVSSCVDEEDVVVESIGNVIVIIMDQQADKLKDSFLSLSDAS